MNSKHPIFGSVIHAYTRAQALEDGVLVAVPEKMQRDAGIRFPMALTRAVWEKCVAWSEADSKHTGTHQDEEGRLWDVVWMTRFAMRSAEGRVANVSLQVVDRTLFTPFDQIESHKWNVKLKAVCGPGDLGEPVITVMLPEED
jgi:hypothetical protein